MRGSIAAWLACGALAAVPVPAQGQIDPPAADPRLPLERVRTVAAAQAATPLTLAQAVRQALDRDHNLAASRFERDAATSGIDVARQSYLPRVDALLQVNRATHNNISGLLFPQVIVSPISGPPSLENSSSSVWGTALGTLVSWQPFDFGSRGATVRAAEQTRARGDAAVTRTELDLAATVADAYLSVLAAQETLRAADAVVARATTLQTVVVALVNSEIRPGVDAATARAEHAAASMQVVLARRAMDAAQALLSRYVGESAALNLVMPPSVAAGGLAPVQATAHHPVLVEQQAAIDEAASRLVVAQRGADPVVALQGTVYGRGTGVLDDNTSGSGADGLGLDAYNWAVGVNVSMPIMEWHNKGAREAAEQLRLQAAQARREDAARELSRRLLVARQEEQASRDVAAQSEVIADAARTVAAQVNARYRAGLSSITDVADAERRLAQAEIDRALAGIAIWRAHLAVSYATATGVESFLNALP